MKLTHSPIELIAQLGGAAYDPIYNKLLSDQLICSDAVTFSPNTNSQTCFVGHFPCVCPNSTVTQDCFSQFAPLFTDLIAAKPRVIIVFKDTSSKLILFS